MRKLVWAGFVLMATFAWPAAGWAEVKIQARVGFPAGGESSRFKLGSWSPVYVTVTNETEQRLPPGCKLLTEAPDSDDLTGQYTQALPELPSGTQETVVTYTRVGNQAGDVTLTIKDPSDRTLATARARRDYQDALGAGTSLYLTLGSPLPDLRTALTPANQDKNAAHPVEFVALTNAQDLPRYWFGYQGIDLLILTTSQQGFVEELLKDVQGRKEALAEWVHRGGRLVISVSGDKHAQLRAELLRRLNLLPCDLVPAEPARWDRLTSLELWVRVRDPFVSSVPGNKIETARLQLAKGPTRRIDVLVRKPEAEGDADDRPLLVQAAPGLGRVVLTAFDLDTAPFTTWNGKDAFWRKLQDLFGTRVDERAGQQNKGGWAVQTNELKSLLQDSLESFEEVPVVSFGWVALFILLYIVVVGPLDYWFLKRVVKRLELTWVTFPVVVLTISVAAYFTAYYLKGNDLKINKIDVVDLFADPDPEGETTSVAHAQGTSWFTLFSPHIKHYTIGIEPAYPGWAAEADTSQANPYAALVSTLDRPDAGFGGMGRQGASGLFRRAYDYDLEQGALVGVPIQVWSTKTFTASWQRRVPRTTKLFPASLRRDDRGVHGWIENRLPAKLQNAVLFYNGEFYPIDDLDPGQRLDDVKLARQQGTFRDTWFQDPYTRPNAAETQPPSGRQVQRPACELMKDLLFHEADPRKDLRNSGLHDLDQGWRFLDPLHAVDEVILVARTAPLDGPAEEVTQNGVSATRLWLDQLPGAGKTRPRLAGTLAQETYVRIYLPIMK
jgi:hypothetical protein